MGHGSRVRAGQSGARKDGRQRVAAAGSRQSGSISTASTAKDENKAIREWAIRKGLDVAPRGRLRQSIVEQYQKSAGR